MRVTVNGVETALAAGASVADLVRERTDQRRVAVARNNEVVPRSEWDTTALTDGDRIEILVAVAGG